MTPSTAKVYLSGIGVVSLAFFFWLFMYQMFVNVNAGNYQVQTVFDTNRMTIAKDDVVEVNPYLLTKDTDRISAATYTLRYPTNVLTYVSTMEQPSKTNSPVRQRCADANYKLNQVIKVDNNPDQGLITITRVALERSENLPSGLFCLGTLTFKAKENRGEMYMNKIQFANLETWQIVGPSSTSHPNPTANNEVLLIYRGN